MTNRAIRTVLAAATTAGLAVVTTVAVTGAPAAAGQGSGNPVLAVSARTLPAGQPATVTVTGTDYLVPPHPPGTAVFGGVYVLFGWVQPGSPWGPSARNSADNDGTYGVTYSYPGESADAGTREDGSGRMRLVSFTPGGESGIATAFHMDDAGNWTATLTVQGSTYTYRDPATGQARTVNCQQTQCGIYTIGAHGKASATNERFVPVVFTGTPAVAPPAGPVGPGGGTLAAPAPSVEGATTGTGSAAAGAPPTGSDAAATATVPTSAPPGTRADTATAPEARRAPRTEPIALQASSADGSGLPWVIPVGLGAVVAAAGGLLWWRHRRRARSEPASPVV